MGARAAAAPELASSSVFGRVRRGSDHEFRLSHPTPASPPRFSSQTTGLGTVAAFGTRSDRSRGGGERAKVRARRLRATLPRSEPPPPISTKSRSSSAGRAVSEPRGGRSSATSRHGRAVRAPRQRRRESDLREKHAVVVELVLPVPVDRNEAARGTPAAEIQPQDITASVVESDAYPDEGTRCQARGQTEGPPSPRVAPGHRQGAREGRRRGEGEQGWDALRANPDAKLGMQANEMPRVLKEGLTRKVLKSKGQKRSTMYTAT